MVSSEKYSLTASCMLLKPGVRSMKGALLSALLSLWQSSHLAKSQIHISQIITTYNVIGTCNCIPTKHSKNKGVSLDHLYVIKAQTNILC